MLGFTPMVKLIRNLCNKNRESKLNHESKASQTAVKLLFFNKTAKDIMWNEELQLLSEQECK